MTPTRCTDIDDVSTGRDLGNLRQRLLDLAATRGRVVELHRGRGVTGDRACHRVVEVVGQDLRLVFRAFGQALERAQLFDEQRTVAQLKLWEGLTFEEIAEAQDIPMNTAASRYRYALDKLRTLLRPIYGELQ